MQPARAVPTEPPCLRDLVTGDLAAYDRRHRTSHAASPVRGALRLAVSPYFAPVLIIRLSAWCAQRGRAGRIAGLLLSRVNYVVFGLEVARQTVIGPGLYMPHTRGTVIGAARIGRDAVVYHGVTLGARTIDIGFDPATRPDVGDDVVLGAGCALVGGLTIGDGVRVGPNAVITSDVAAGALVVAPAAVVVER